MINDEHRKDKYIECIKQILYLTKNDPLIKPIIVENNGLRPTYLDGLGCDILYTNNNNIWLKEKGGNELLDIKEVIRHYNIGDNDTIIKLTGRYKLLNRNFIDLVKNNSDICDAFVKFFNVCTKQFMFDDCVLGLFAVKCKYLKAFEYQFVRSPECEFADYIRQNVDGHKIMELLQLDLECCSAHDLGLLVV